MRWCLLTAVAAIFLLSGCGDLDSIASSLDEKTEPTYQFWAQLQGIEYHQFPEVQRLLKAVPEAGKEYDVDKIADILSRVSDQHGHMAQQLSNLDEADVDEEAIAFRDRLEESHRDLAAAYKSFSQAAKDRDFAGVGAGRQELPGKNANFVSVWNGRTAVMAGLKEKYSRDFNVVP